MSVISEQLSVNSYQVRRIIALKTLSKQIYQELFTDNCLLETDYCPTISALMPPNAVNN